MEVFLNIVLLVVILGIWVVSTQRRLVVMDENINSAMSQIGIQLSSRFDALIALLDLVKTYSTQDVSFWEKKVKALRREIHAKSSPQDAIEQETLIIEVLKFVDLAVQKNPEMTDDANYIKRMGAVETYERMLHTSYLIYNDSVAKLNQSIRMFPTKWIAGVIGFHQRDYFEKI